MALTVLARLSLNGHYQEARYLNALLSGLAFALRDGVKTVLAPLKVGRKTVRRGDTGVAMPPASASTR